MGQIGKGTVMRTLDPVGVWSSALTFRYTSGNWRFLFILERNNTTVPLDAWVPPSERGKAFVVSVSVESLRYADDDYLWQFMADSLEDAEWRCVEYVREVSRLHY